jgi:prophage antirepressor-like protein
MASVNKVQIFFNTVLENVDTVEIDGIILFVVKDVCELLEIPFFAVNRLDTDEKTYIYQPDRYGNPKCKITLITEAGLYNLALFERGDSDNELVKLLKGTLEGDILPLVEKYGAYIWF